ncbi:MAG TPA: crossover junction endodeoxyribonuclease RuvC [Pyrinomonadaceae bacterium]|nr:crossover junction endodeoxyribonuclease RuvC [Pyrinomonadaceae bacterium]
MLVLGIDPGSEVLGWGAVQQIRSRYKVAEFGALRLQKKEAFPNRLAQIFQHVDGLIHRFSPDVLAVEEAFYSNNASVAIKLGEIRGVILLAAQLGGIEIAQYSPRRIKQSVVGYGNAQKQQVGEMVRRLLGLEQCPKPEDISDALAVAICHINHSGRFGQLSKTISGSR